MSSIRFTPDIETRANELIDKLLKIVNPTYKNNSQKISLKKKKT